MMDKWLVVLSLVLLVMLATQEKVWGAADCGEPAPAPQYQVGEKWTWRDEKGKESTDQVIQVEEELTQMKWASGEVGFYDKDWILRQVKRVSGELVTKQGAGQYVTIGQKTLDFPLHVGKQWEYSYTAQPRSGLWTLQTYYHRFKVVACEDVTMPAGKFPAFKVEVEQSVAGGRGSGTYYFWYAPQVKNSVRREYVASQWWSGGRFLDTELVKYEPK